MAALEATLIKETDASAEDLGPLPAWGARNGYCRVSTDEQASAGISLDSQREKIAIYAKLHNLELVGLEVDPGASGKSLERPGLKRALAALEAGQANVLVIAKLDRLSRSIGDWQKRMACLHCHVDRLAAGVDAEASRARAG